MLSGERRPLGVLWVSSSDHLSFGEGDGKSAFSPSDGKRE